MYLIEVDVFKKFCSENRVQFNGDDRFSTVDCDNKTYILVNARLQDCALSGRSKPVITDAIVENEIDEEIAKNPNSSDSEKRQIRNSIVEKYHDNTHVKGKYNSPSMFYSTDDQNVKKLNESEAMKVLKNASMVSSRWKHEPFDYHKIVILDEALDYEKEGVFPRDVYRDLIVSKGRAIDPEYKSERNV